MKPPADAASAASLPSDVRGWTAPSAGVCNIASTLVEAARREPDAVAVVVQRRRRVGQGVTYRRWTFGELERESAQLAAGLAAAGVARGMRVAVMVRPGIDFFALMFAIFRLGAVPVLVDPGIGLRHLKACLGQARPEAFVGIALAQAARVALGWARESLRLVVTVGPRLGWSGLTLGQVRRMGGAALRPAAGGAAAVAPTRADDTAAILFTSGSTGAPKGVVYTHGIFADQIACLRETYGLGPGDCDVSTFPPFALFGPGLGMASVVPAMDPTRPGRANPRRIVAAVTDWQATSLFGSPALLARVGRWGAERGVRLPSLRRVVSAGAPAREATLRQFGAMLGPGVEIFTPYGATEALPVCSIGSAEALGETATLTTQGAGVCVGSPVARVEVAVIRLTDEPIAQWNDCLRLPVGQIGEIAVKGPRVTRAYFERPEATALAKIADSRDGSVWHRMGDVGYLDAAGRLWFCGRKSHRVRLADGRDLFSIPCERIFDAHPAVARTALVGVPAGPAAAPKRPVLCVELARRLSRVARARLREELLTLGSVHAETRDVKTVLFHQRFPVDIRHNAKIGREALARWAERQLR